MSGYNTSPACTYSNLQNYNGYGASTSPPVPASTVRGSYIVPAYGTIGYDTLTHGSSMPSCSGYFNIQNAYGSDAGDCNTQYTQSSCQ